MALAPNTGYGLLNPGTTTSNQTNANILNPPPNTGYGMLNPGTTLPKPVPAPVSRQILPRQPGQTISYPQQQSGGGFPDYTLDPAYQAAMAMEQQSMAQLDAQLQAARQRAIINFGDPALAQEAGFQLDPTTAALAQQNEQSGNATLARLQHAHQLNARGIVNDLAAHGILNSGDYGYREGEENRGYGNNVYDAQQAVLDQLSNMYSQYLNSRTGLQSNVLNALLQLAANAGQTAGGGYYPTDYGTQANPPISPTSNVLTRGGYTLAPSSTAKRKISTVSGYGF